MVEVEGLWPSREARLIAGAWDVQQGQVRLGGDGL